MIDWDDIAEELDIDVDVLHELREKGGFIYAKEDWLNSNGYSRLNHDVCLIYESPKAGQYAVDGKEVWFPKSVMRFDENDNLWLPMWFINKNGFKTLFYRG